MVPPGAHPRVEDLAAFVEEVARVRARHEGRLLVCVMPPEGHGPPPPEVREALMAATPELLSHCDAMHLVVTGRGVTGALLRAAFRAMLVFQGLHKRIFVHADIDDFAAATGEGDAAALLQQLRAERKARAGAVSR
jgi:hypothetical protein